MDGREECYKEHAFPTGQFDRKSRLQKSQNKKTSHFFQHSLKFKMQLQVMSPHPPKYCVLTYLSDNLCCSRVQHCYFCCCCSSTSLRRRRL